LEVYSTLLSIVKQIYLRTLTIIELLQKYKREDKDFQKVRKEAERRRRINEDKE